MHIYIHIYTYMFIHIHLHKNIYMYVNRDIDLRMLRSHMTKEFRDQFDSGLIQYLTGDYISRFLCHFSHAFFRTSLCVLRTHIESRFCNPHVVILLN
jgi:hypothetical protein